VHDEDNAHHGESSDRRNAKRRFYEPALKRQIRAQSIGQRLGARQIVN
jgi:hypothetical protein